MRFGRPYDTKKRRYAKESALKCIYFEDVENMLHEIEIIRVMGPDKSEDGRTRKLNWFAFQKKKSEKSERFVGR